MSKNINDIKCNCEHHHHTHNDCQCEHHHETKQNQKSVKMCILEDGVICTNCGACDMCDLDPEKVCDNCGKCLDELVTNEKGFVEVPIDKIIMGESEEDELNQLLALYGLDEEDEDDEE